MLKDGLSGNKNVHFWIVLVTEVFCYHTHICHKYVSYHFVFVYLKPGNASNFHNIPVKMCQHRACHANAVQNLQNLKPKFAADDLDQV